MQLAMLNLIIEGERLKSLLTLDQLQELNHLVNAWQESVNQVVLNLQKPFSESDKAMLAVLIDNIDVLQAGLVPLREKIVHDQQQLLRGNSVAHAYMSSGG
jgi:hypothetical protein